MIGNRTPVSRIKFRVSELLMFTGMMIRLLAVLKLMVIDFFRGFSKTKPVCVPTCFIFSSYFALSSIGT